MRETQAIEQKGFGLLHVCFAHCHANWGLVSIAIGHKRLDKRQLQVTEAIVIAGA